jgi:nitroreductase
MADTPHLNDTSSGTLGLLLTRRSGSAKSMTAPGPSDDELRRILAAGMRAPDHGKLAPWRFILFEGEARHGMGRLLVEFLRESEPQTSEERLAMERNRFARAPIVVAVVSRVREGIPIPVWEQELSAGAVCQNILISAHSLGYVANWVTEWCAYDGRVMERLGLKVGERIAGYIYIGTSAVPLEERIRPDPDALITRFEG